MYEITLNISINLHMIKDFAKTHGCTVKSMGPHLHLFQSESWDMLHELAESYLQYDPTNEIKMV